MDLGYVCALQRSARRHPRWMYFAFGNESVHFSGIQPVLDAMVVPKSSRGKAALGWNTGAEEHAVPVVVWE